MIVLRPYRQNRQTFLVWRPEHDETEEDACEVSATDNEEAAEDFAEHDDSGGDYCIVGGSKATLHVRSPDGTVAVFVVTGESVPQYSAREKSTL